MVSRAVALRGVFFCAGIRESPTFFVQNRHFVQSPEPQSPGRSPLGLKLGHSQNHHAVAGGCAAY